MAMACITLFLLVFVATRKAASISSHSCNTSPLSASGDDVDTTDLSQVNTSLQYCMIDNCTIMRIDTGEELDIVYITESLLVAAPTDGHTSEVFLAFENEVPCFPVHTESSPFVIGVLTSFSITLGFVRAYIVVVHLLFSELRTVFGILLMSFNAAGLVVVVFFMPLYLLHYVVALGSQLVCQSFMYMFMFTVMITESYTTCIMFHIAYTMYLSSMLRSEMPKNLLLRYNCFVFGLLAVIAAIIIGYDLHSGNGKQTILPSGYCLFNNEYSSYQTHLITDFHNSAHKVAHMSLLAIFLFYYYNYKKHSNIIAPASRDNSNVNPTRVQVSKLLFRIAVAMGAFVGIARIIFVTTAIFAPSYTDVTTHIGLFALLLQHCVVMGCFMCTRKMSRLCRERFCPQENQQ